MPPLIFYAATNKTSAVSHYVWRLGLKGLYFIYFREICLFNGRIVAKAYIHYCSS